MVRVATTICHDIATPVVRVAGRAEHRLDSALDHRRAASRRVRVTVGKAEKTRLFGPALKRTHTRQNRPTPRVDFFDRLAERGGTSRALGTLSEKPPRNEATVLFRGGLDAERSGF